MQTEIDFSSFEFEELESRQLFAAAAVPHHLINLNLPLDLSLQVNNPANGQTIINLNLPADLSLHVNQPSLAGLGSTLSSITTPVTGLVTGVVGGIVSPLLGTVTGLLGSVLAAV
ncbi:hypothetical protein [Candidatus Methylacidiphilum infernorum]|uniref:Uncharacterized protein n=1 Tax=Methylacidiphilum infernorum (isolate V4) TaxID=481448 RepID=B3DZG0_METI4|nr:hypothetical protein [Candidatus Methylacidiphilum infernorum]ACD82577.1 Hypothetical protein Minf_0519 [Methylacidiphilum infernorum V4]